MKPLLLEIPDDFEVEYDEDGSRIVTVALAESADQLVSVQCCFMDIDNAGSVEFTFAIVVTPTNGQAEPLIIFDRDEAVKYVPDAYRHFVMPTVCNALRALVEAENPEFIYFSAYQPGPETRSLQKYRDIIDALEAISYYVIEIGTDGENREFWFLEHDNEQDSNNQASNDEESP